MADFNSEMATHLLRRFPLTPLLLHSHLLLLLLLAVVSLNRCPASPTPLPPLSTSSCPCPGICCCSRRFAAAAAAAASGPAGCCCLEPRHSLADVLRILPQPPAALCHHLPEGLIFLCAHSLEGKATTLHHIKPLLL
jgi:hypothetical protein